MSTWRTRLAGASVISAMVILFGVWPPMAGDFLMHLTVGRYTWEHGWPPMVDVFSFVTEGQEFVAHSWLAGLIFYLIERSVGTMGFMLLRLALISVALACAVRTARLLKAPWPAIILLAPVVFTVMWGRLEVRPQLFTTAFLAVELWLLMSVHTGQRSWWWLWVLPPCYALSVNLHGGWPQVLLMLLVVACARIVMPNSHLPRRHLGVVLVACLLALFINPYGLRLIYFPLEM